MNDLDDLSEMLEALETAERKLEAGLPKAEAARKVANEACAEVGKAAKALGNHRRMLGNKRKAAIGFAFYDLLEKHGLREVLEKHCKSATEHPAAVRRALKAHSPKLEGPVAAAVVLWIAKSLDLLAAKSASSTDG